MPPLAEMTIFYRSSYCKNGDIYTTKRFSRTFIEVLYGSTFTHTFNPYATIYNRCNPIPGAGAKQHAGRYYKVKIG